MGVLKNYIYPVAALAGSIIGVGFLSLPYIAVKVGMLAMLGYFVAITALMVYVNIISGEISMKTPDHKRFPGFVQYHLGAWPKAVALVSTILGSFGILLVYLVLVGQFLEGMFPGGLSQSWFVLLFFATGSVIVYFGIGLVSRIEFWALCLLVCSLAWIFISGIFRFHVANILWQPTGVFSPAMVFLPYGALVFSLSTNFIPEIEEMVRGRKETLKRIIMAGTLVPAAMYLVFTLVVVGITGSATSESALVGLALALGQQAGLVVLFAGVVIIFIAFITQGVFLQEVLMYDMRLSKRVAWLLTCFVPLMLFLLGIHSFVFLISFLGTVFAGIGMLLVMAMYVKVGGKKWVAFSLSILFLAVIAYQLITFRS